MNKLRTSTIYGELVPVVKAQSGNGSSSSQKFSRGHWTQGTTYKGSRRARKPGAEGEAAQRLATAAPGEAEEKPRDGAVPARCRAPSGSWQPALCRLGLSSYTSYWQTGRLNRQLPLLTPTSASIWTDPCRNLLVKEDENCGLQRCMPGLWMDLRANWPSTAARHILNEVPANHVPGSNPAHCPFL